MDKLVSAIIEANTGDRLAQIAHCRVSQHITKSIGFGEEKIHIYQVGSFSEGMNNYGDLDLMTMFSTFPVVLWPSQSKGENQNGSFVIAEQNLEEPAFLKLRAVDRSCIHENLRNAIDRNGYLRSTTFITCMMLRDNEKIIPDTGLSKFNLQGPSLQGALNLKNHDYVYCWKCQSWPPSITCEYFNRKRPNQWPPQKLLNEISLLDCHVVAIGHPSSASKHIEWRLSFSLAEKELIHKMDEPFANCMYALKCVKNEFIVYSDSDKPTPFCSYFMKTACLWTYETLPNKDYSVINLIRRVLDWLIDSYKNKNLPHYFIPEQNLIGHLTVERCDDVRAKLTAVKRDIWTLVMKSVDKNQYINRVLRLFSELNIPRGSGDDNYKTVKSILLNHPIATEILEQCIYDIRTGDNIQSQFQTMRRVVWAGTRFQNIFSQVDLLIKLRAFSEILRSPEGIILPIVENIDEIVPEGYGNMFKTRLYRVLGDMYMYILIYFRKIGYHDYPAFYKDKPLQYYTLGAKMMYLSKWSDRCIGSRALKVQYHYLMGNYETLKKIVDWKPVLSKLKENDFLINSVCPININIDSVIVLSAWGIDEKLQQRLKRTVGCRPVNPIVFIFYVMARVHLREGDLEKATAVVKEMKGCLKILYRYAEITKSMIELIEIEILELRRILYFSNALTPIERPALAHILYPST